MKKPIIVFLLFTLSLIASEIEWQPSFKAAQTKALKTNKPIIAILVSHTCHWCRRLENRTLEDPKIINMINCNYVPVLLYREDRNFPLFIHSKMVPTTFFLTPSGKNIIRPSIGYWEADEYMTDLSSALRRFPTRH